MTLSILMVKRYTTVGHIPFWSVFHLAQVLYTGLDPAEAVALEFTGSVTAIAGSGDAGGLDGSFFATSRASSGMLLTESC
jgi:hypothetical protein